MNLKLPT